MRKKYFNLFFAAAVCFFAVACGSSKVGRNTYELKFNSEGYFKITQFTDMHWNDSSAGCRVTEAIIKAVLDKERPDLIIVTGDVVYDPPAREGWDQVIKIFSSTGIPWAVTMGNHDGEAEEGFTTKDIFDMLEGKPGYVGSKGYTGKGIGNFSLPVSGYSSGRTAAVIYCFDSNDYAENSKLSYYDWIHACELEWYRKTSSEYAQFNQGVPIPSLAFFHIPLLEYYNIVGKPNTIGNKFEGISSADINSGAFASFIEQGDVMGVFTGHDHNNDFIGIWKNIALAFGRVTGDDAYGKLERGARIIKLYENERKFDTWISTPKGEELLFYYPSGLSKDEEDAADYLPAKSLSSAVNGIMYKYYEGGRFKHTDHIKDAELMKTGKLENFSLQPALSADSMAFVFNTYIQIPERGIYSFYTESDDGSKLLIDGLVVVDNDGSHNKRRVFGKVALEKGLHEMTVLYFQDHMGKSLEVGIASRNIMESPIPADMLFIPENIVQIE